MEGREEGGRRGGVEGIVVQQKGVCGEGGGREVSGISVHTEHEAEKLLL
jgi:hypothetical protein